MQGSELDEKTSQTSTEITCSPLHSTKLVTHSFPNYALALSHLSTFAHASPFAGMLSELSLPIKILNILQSPIKCHLYLYIY